jgi:electron transport complex protein RnfG
MKTVFNFAALALPLSFAAAAFAPASARADQTFWTTRDLLADPSFFGHSEKVAFKQIEPAAVERARIEERLGYRLPRDRYTIFIATTGSHVDGYAIFDDEPGQHLPITFAVKISPSGAVERQEIVAYREARGDEVRDERFKRQFIGKTSRDPLRAGDDIAAVSGATISSRAMASGVKRALVLVEELVLRPQQASSVTARR